MIHEVAFLPPGPGVPFNAFARWAWDLPEIAAHDRGRTVRFRPGLNVLFGRNGSGKTTVLRSIALTLAATGTGTSVAGQEWLREALDPRIMQGDGPLPNLAARVVHDGKPVVYAAAGVMPGVSERGLSEEFLPLAALSKTAVRGRSAGERTFESCAHALSILHGKARFPKAIERPLESRRAGMNTLWNAMIDKAEAELLAPNGPEGQPTILLDEPDAHWGFVSQALLWDTLGKSALAKRYQIIVASHSPFALAVPHARIIGLPEQAVADTRLAMADLAARMARGGTGKPASGRRLVRKGKAADGTSGEGTDAGGRAAKPATGSAREAAAPRPPAEHVARLRGLAKPRAKPAG